MDYLQKFVAQVRSRLFLVLLINNVFLILDLWLMHNVLHLSLFGMIISLGVISLLAITILPWVTASFITEPTKLIWQGILHIAPDVANVPAPDLKKRGV